MKKLCLRTVSGLRCCRQPITFMRVDLPDPDGPMLPAYSFMSMVRSTPRKAWMISLPMR